ncbi:MBL fold metallo-hydrolase [Ktedonosporobacter rubrisoli]|uniref:MBL fold metallo-hydrolase n=1 Tax=Ktedonosporobacter rubrisoli TaxID=2509675 RepID=A0A4P6JLH0_KTERU|nr:MBL fold metallo-hydrolase [Ktedonosporobacter rubrisoli]QBD76058.1 MBL fold metallo-hydrolase [Ktedonosporobacter rubrisoli]
MVSAATYSSILLGNIRISYLPDGYILFNPMALFPTTSAADWQPYQHLLDSNGQLVGSLGAYLLQTPGKAILVDNGFGPRSYEGDRFKAYGGELLSNLERAGLKPADIDIVFFTHMHSDHVGWSGHKANGKQVLTFPNARHLVRNAEWLRFDNPEEKKARASVADELNLLGQHIEFLEEGEYITPEVRILATPGHTPGHASLLVTAGDERAIILGDIFHSILQIEHPEWTNAFDRDPEQAKTVRRRMLQELAKPSITGGATHVADSVFISLS